ncbi:uncharacterized protein CBD139 isoform X23 [Canis lupus familiaris]|uniref:uncharacterized protein CBD139 isoform X23 n=1 Tax=Canis lupus familiaris TaxID=9615 RepID=UPI000BAA0016|nr:uncharacterized protein CBD139 isoform X23 [Canis lupus familiaris]XP_038416465.1 uncharacterized protein CBD139 isoform X17 [Canis lupus familiaris]|eukprot:XP_022260001.1 uncharacterized protein CBD139 isoform X2 [Canis lupus familiaris]
MYSSVAEDHKPPIYSPRKPGSVTMRLLHVVLTAAFLLSQVLPDSTGAFNFERPCYLRGGNCLKRGTPNCEPFRGPCRAFTVCCKAKGSGRKRSSQGTLAPRAKARLPLSK